MPSKIIIQYLNLNLEIFSTILSLLYAMKWKTKNRIINEIGNLCDKTKGRIFEVWKSIIISL